MNAATTSVRIGQTTGYLFATKRGDDVCFVPEECLRFGSCDQIAVDDATYLVSGRARKNGFLNPSIPGHRLFPNARALWRDFGAPTVAEFLRRIRQMEYLPIPAA